MFVAGKTPDATIVIAKGEKFLGTDPLMKCKGECVASVASIVRALPTEKWVKYLVLDKEAGSYVYTEKEVKGVDVFAFDKHKVVVSEDGVSFIDAEISKMREANGEVNASAGLTVSVDETSKLIDALNMRTETGDIVPDVAVLSAGDTLKYFLILGIKKSRASAGFDAVKVKAVSAMSDGTVLDSARYTVTEEIRDIIANVEKDESFCLYIIGRKTIKICIGENIFLEKSA